MFSFLITQYEKFYSSFHHFLFEKKKAFNSFLDGLFNDSDCLSTNELIQQILYDHLNESNYQLKRYTTLYTLNGNTIRIPVDYSKPVPETIPAIESAPIGSIVRYEVKPNLDYHAQESCLSSLHSGAMVWMLDHNKTWTLLDHRYNLS